MNIFDEVDESLFRPLTSINKRKYVDILALIWSKCKRMPMYALEKSTIFDLVTDYFYGLDEQVKLDEEEKEATDGNSADVRIIAGGFVRRLKDTGWLLEKNGEYEEEAKLAINYKVVPIIKSFQEIISPAIITYKGKLFKIYSMFEHISEQGSPYEGVLKEASEDFDNLNQALRTLAASIEDHINSLTQGKKPEEVLDFFEKYEEKIVVGSYHRFKTNDNLFYYRTSLYENLDKCEDVLFDALVNDYMDAERVEKSEASYKIKELISKVRMDIEEMEAIMRTIDDRHIIYRTRAVQRAQFLLLSDGSVKSKINNLLQYYASGITNKEDLYEDDETIVYDVFQIFGQNYFDSASLAAPIKKKRSTPIELMAVIDELDMELVEEKNRKMLEYIKNALTSENVNGFAQDILNGKIAVSIGSVFADDPNSLVKIIGLYTYSETPEREYEIRLKDNYIESNGFKFRDFIVEKRKTKS
ncbi:MAG: Wadjet anti-phage system protein JetA family protein [bacterium]